VEARIDLDTTEVLQEKEELELELELELEPSAWLGFGLLHFACTVIATNRTTTGLTINTQTNATGIAN